MPVSGVSLCFLTDLLPLPITMPTPPATDFRGTGQKRCENYPQREKPFVRSQHATGCWKRQLHTACINHKCAHQFYIIITMAQMNPVCRAKLCRIVSPAKCIFLKACIQNSCAELTGNLFFPFHVCMPSTNIDIYIYVHLYIFSVFSVCLS